MLNIINKTLIKSGSYINGCWITNNTQFDVLNPATQAHLISVNDAQASDAINAVESAKSAFKGWTALTSYQRADYLNAWSRLITENEQDLARLLTLEQGKTLSEALGEIRYGVSYLHWFSEEGKRIYGDTISAASSQQRIIVSKQPVGVVTAITPWNFPNAMLLRKAAAALSSGCTFVIKPAAETPLSALALASLAEEAGIPKGVLNVIVGSDAPSIGKVLTEHPDVNKFSFTGSTAIGKKLLAQCAKGVKKVSMELGGNAPFIVFESADIDSAVSGLMSNKFRNAGQTCVCTNRVFVQDSIFNEFTDKVINALKEIKVGGGLNSSSTMGPLVSKKAADKVCDLIGTALSQGASLAYQNSLSLNNKALNNKSLKNTATNLSGDQEHQLKNDCFVAPTLLTNVTNEMEIAQSEIFGPVISLIRFENEQQVIEQANKTKAGLAAYFYSQQVNQIWRVSESLQFGMVGINESALSNAAAPFGGIKESGSGREGSHYGLDDYLEIKYLCFGGIE